MTLCNTCGHVTWHTAGIRACGHCDLMGCWPRVNGTAVDWEEVCRNENYCRHCGLKDTNGPYPHAEGCPAVSVDRTGHASAENPPYDWANDGPWTIEGES